MQQKKHKVLNWLKCYPLFYSLGGSNIGVQPASFSAAIKVSLPRRHDVKLEKFNASYCLKITVSLWACSKCACAVTKVYPLYRNRQWHLNLPHVNLAEHMLVLLKLRFLCIVSTSEHCVKMRVVCSYNTKVVKEQKGILVLSRVQYILSLLLCDVGVCSYWKVILWRE